MLLKFRCPDMTPYRVKFETLTAGCIPHIFDEVNVR